MRWRRTTACERAAQWISLELDDELSGLERAALVRHLGRCAACGTARTQIGGFTELMRQAPPVPLERPVAVGGRRARTKRLGWQLVATLAVATGIAGAAGLFSTGGGSNEPRGALSFGSVQERLRFAHVEHLRVEPRIFVVAEEAPTPPSFASRVLG